MSGWELRRSGTPADSTLTAPAALEVDESNRGSLLTGYASVFDSVYSVTEGGQTFNEVVRAGSFKASLARNPYPVIQVSHGHDTGNGIGQLPIGKVRTAREDSEGLYFEAELFDSPALDLLKEGLRAGLFGASFRFRVAPGGERWTGDKAPKLRELTRLDVAELGPTVWPASPATSTKLRTKLDQAKRRTGSTLSPRAVRCLDIWRGGVVRWADLPVDVRSELTRVAPKRTAALRSLDRAGLLGPATSRTAR